MLFNLKNIVKDIGKYLLRIDELLFLKKESFRKLIFKIMLKIKVWDFDNLP
jgi:hypothetical protein